MLQVQIHLLTVWWNAAEAVNSRLQTARHDDRGEVTAQTAMIVLLVIAAIGAATIIATKITNNANNVPSP